VKKREAFTLVELIIAVFIMAILAAIAIPILRGRTEAAAWSEGKAMMGTIATAIRAYAAEKDTNGNYGAALPTPAELGFADSDLLGTYFGPGNYSWTTTFDPLANPSLTFTVMATAPAGITTPPAVTLNHTGSWTP